MSRNDQIVYAGEANVRRMLRMIDSSKGSSVEFLNSNIVPEPLIRFSGSNALSHATRFVQHAAAAEGLSIEVREITAKSRQKGYAATYDSRSGVLEVDTESDILDALLLCHELAHAVSSSHTQRFQKRYVELVGKHIGPVVALLLQHELLNPTAVGTE